MTLSCNHIALNSVMIGANEYEGHYAFDLLYIHRYAYSGPS
ncbi:MAG: hypothetical protein V3T17_07185 [Pseudomonadales bacterium]